MNVVDLEDNVPSRPFINGPDAAAFIAKHQDGVWRYLRAIGCDSNLADDLTQETFLAVLRRPFEWVNDAASAGYLRRVAYHLLISSRRKSERMFAVDTIELLDTDWVRWAGFDGGEGALEALTDCFQRLTKRAQASLKMRFGENASRDVIAKELGITEHGAKNLMQRAKNQLRECIENKLK